ncbi:ABC transporter ATP-binding protein [Bariatricus sp. SGI.019]|uniref:ABC transporter ATP-binding protein n=1 Tax=Bariatricus sp. SGI.019 TaxID=3420548 RepID=UPI003CFD3164
MTILRVENLTKIYGTGETKVKALDHVSFNVEKGEFIAITGASGSGKSTLLHLMGGVEKATEGRVLIGNTDILALNENEQAVFRRRHIGLIYQFYNLIPILTVEENILLPLLLDGKKINTKRLSGIVKMLGLEARREHLLSQLSGGQQQRVAIGRALITRPAIILADEPTGNLDQKNTLEIMHLFRILNQRLEQTILMITHDLDLAKQCDRIIRIEDGRV